MISMSKFYLIQNALRSKTINKQKLYYTTLLALDQSAWTLKQGRIISNVTLFSIVHTLHSSSVFHEWIMHGKYSLTAWNFKTIHSSLNVMCYLHNSVKKSFALHLSLPTVQLDCFLVMFVHNSYWPSMAVHLSFNRYKEQIQTCAFTLCSVCLKREMDWNWYNSTSIRR